MLMEVEHIKLTNSTMKQKMCIIGCIVHKLVVLNRLLTRKATFNKTTNTHTRSVKKKKKKKKKKLLNADFIQSNDDRVTL